MGECTEIPNNVKRRTKEHIEHGPRWGNTLKYVIILKDETHSGQNFNTLFCVVRE